MLNIKERKFQQWKISIHPCYHILGTSGEADQNPSVALHVSFESKEGMGVLRNKYKLLNPSNVPNV